MKVRVDRDLCTGMAYCVEVAPTVFELDDEMKAYQSLDCIGLYCPMPIVKTAERI